MNNIINFILKSSANPQATSASLKFALLGVIPYLMQLTNLVCEWGNQCYDIDPNLLETIVDALANGTLGRKLWRTINGTNLALSE